MMPAATMRLLRPALSVAPSSVAVTALRRTVARDVAPAGWMVGPSSSSYVRRNFSPKHPPSLALLVRCDSTCRPTSGGGSAFDPQDRFLGIRHRPGRHPRFELPALRAVPAAATATASAAAITNVPATSPGVSVQQQCATHYSMVSCPPHRLLSLPCRGAWLSGCVATVSRGSDVLGRGQGIGMAFGESAHHRGSLGPQRALAWLLSGRAPAPAATQRARVRMYHSTPHTPKANETENASAASSSPPASANGDQPPAAPSPASSSSSTSPPSTSGNSGTAVPPKPPLSSSLVGDQMTVIAVAVLTLLLILSPALVDRIRNREQYDEFFNFDDPIDDLTLELYRLSRDECNDDDNEDGNEGEGGKKEGGAAAPRQKNVVENLLREVFQSAALQEAAQQFVVATLQSDAVRQALQRLLKELALDLLQDPETIAQVVQLLNVAIQNDQVRKAAQLLVIDLVNDPSVKAALVSVIQRLGQDGAVQETAQSVLKDTAHALLNDDDVMDHSMEFATDVLGDDVVQQTAGEALRNTVGHAVRPAATSAVWVVAGLAWMAVAFLALGYANHSFDLFGGSSSSTRALEGMDRAITLSNGGSSNQQSLMNMISSLPGRILSTLLWPIQLAGATIRKPFVAMGRSVQHGTGSALSWVSSLPSRIIPSRESLSRLPGVFVAAALWPIRKLGSLVGTSFQYVTKGLGESLSTASQKVSDSVHASAISAGAFLGQSATYVVVGSTVAVQNLAQAAWTSTSGAATWTLHQTGRFVSYALTRVSAAMDIPRVWSTCRGGYHSSAAWMGHGTDRVNDTLVDWALAVERAMATCASRVTSFASSKMNGTDPP